MRTLFVTTEYMQHIPCYIFAVSPFHSLLFLIIYRSIFDEIRSLHFRTQFICFIITVCILMLMLDAESGVLLMLRGFDDRRQQNSKYPGNKLITCQICISVDPGLCCLVRVLNSLWVHTCVIALIVQACAHPSAHAFDLVHS